MVIAKTADEVLGTVEHQWVNHGILYSEL